MSALDAVTGSLKKAYSPLATLCRAGTPSCSCVVVAKEPAVRARSVKSPPVDAFTRTEYVQPAQ